MSNSKKQANNSDNRSKVDLIMPLKLKILDSGEYVARGSLVVRVLQGNGIDDLVRESIQNSLDAAKKGEKSIHVDFTLNTLKKETVTRQFERASASRLNNRFADERECRLLAIRDTGTTGLTRKLRRRKQ